MEAFKKYLRCFDSKYYTEVLCANLEDTQDQIVQGYYQYWQENDASNKIDPTLITAIESGKLEKIQELIRHGVQLNAWQEHNTPLMWAIASNHPNRLKLVKILLEHHAEVNSPYRTSGGTPLLLALAEKKQLSQSFLF